MAKAEAQGGADKPTKKKKTFKKRGEKRVVHHGFVHIQASFNNTLITITDAEGAVVSWSSAGAHRLQGVAQGHAVCGHAGGADRDQRRQDVRDALVRGAGEGPGLGPRVGDSRAVDGGSRGEVDSRRHADSAQRLPAAEATSRVRTLTVSSCQLSVQNDDVARVALRAAFELETDNW